MGQITFSNHSLHPVLILQRLWCIYLCLCVGKNTFSFLMPYILFHGLTLRCLYLRTSIFLDVHHKKLPREFPSCQKKPPPFFTSRKLCHMFTATFGAMCREVKLRKYLPWWKNQELVGRLFWKRMKMLTSYLLSPQSRAHHVPVQFCTYRVWAHAVATHGGTEYFLEKQETSCCGHYVVFSCVGAFKYAPHWIKYNILKV